MRGRAWAGRSPAAAATSSRLLPEATESSKALACLLRFEKRKVLSRITVQDQSEAPARPSMTAFTTQSAFMNRTKKLRLSGVTAGGSMRSKGSGMGGDRAETRKGGKRAGGRLAAGLLWGG